MDYIALFLVFFVAIVIFYGIIVIHDIPYEIAVHRNHPHQDAIHVAGWISLFTLNVIWPFLWIWATLYREDQGWGLKNPNNPEKIQLEELSQELESLKQDMREIQQALNKKEGS